MWGVMPIINGKFMPSITDVSNLDSESQLLHSMVTCHTLTIIRTKLCGDPMDLKVNIFIIDTRCYLTWINKCSRVCLLCTVQRYSR